MRHQGQMHDATVQCSCERLECTLLHFLQRVPVGGVMSEWVICVKERKE